MKIPAEVVFRMGEPTGEQFHRYWDLEVVGATAVSSARFNPEQKPAAGAGFVLPAEVIIATGQVIQLLQSDLAKEVLKTAGTAVGTAVAKFIWNKLVDFFKKPQPTPVPEWVMIIIDRREIVFSPRAMEPDPPQDLLNALDIGE
jgi:hypothetical protein